MSVFIKKKSNQFVVKKLLTKNKIYKLLIKKEIRKIKLLFTIYYV